MVSLQETKSHRGCTGLYRDVLDLGLKAWGFPKSVFPFYSRYKGYCLHISIHNEFQWHCPFPFRSDSPF